MESILIEFKGRLAYRSNLIFSVLVSIVSVLVQLALWQYLYRGDTAMQNYMAGYVIYASLMSTVYSNQMYHVLAGKILNGDFIIDLIRPVNIIWFSYLKSLGAIAAQLLLQTCPMFLLFSPILASVTSWNRLGYFVLALLAGHILSTLIFAAVGFAAFLFVEVWALRRLTEDTLRFLSGAMLPIALFPGPLRAASQFLPFRYLYDFPLRLLLEESMEPAWIAWEFLGALFWGAVLGILLYAVYRAALRFCVVQGG